MVNSQTPHPLVQAVLFLSYSTVVVQYISKVKLTVSTQFSKLYCCVVNIERFQDARIGNWYSKKLMKVNLKIQCRLIIIIQIYFIYFFYFILFVFSIVWKSLFVWCYALGHWHEVWWWYSWKNAGVLSQILVWNNDFCCIKFGKALYTVSTLGYNEEKILNGKINFFCHLE